MKRLTLFAAVLLGMCYITYGQKISSPPLVAVFPIDSKGVVLDPHQLANLIRIELEKAGLFNVYDRYDLASKLEKEKLSLENCYSRNCLLESGKTLGVSKVISGSVERYNEKILITLKLLDIESGKVEKNQINEFLNVQPSLQAMLAICLRDMLGLPNDKDLVNKLTSPAYESSLNNPGVNKLNLSGPRMGFVVAMGEEGSRIRGSMESGGFDALPLMSQFGYQFESQYLNSGNFQALVEFIPLVTGIDQGFFIPSFTVLNGLRNNKSGFEFAFGPTFSIGRRAVGYYDQNGNWHLKDEWQEVDPNGNPLPNPNALLTRIDSRGNPMFSSGFVFAFGKTFKSGNLNIPVNLFIIPGKEGVRAGISFGFNTKK
jgi:hypothetical protein